MKGFKFWMSLVMLALVATACSKKKDGGAAPKKDSSAYYLQGDVCYDRDTDKRVSRSYCDDDSSQNACVGYVYYINLEQGYMDRFDCRNPNAVDVHCQAPKKYLQDGETYECYEIDGNDGYDTNNYYN